MHGPTVPHVVSRCAAILLAAVFICPVEAGSLAPGLCSRKGRERKRRLSNFLFKGCDPEKAHITSTHILGTSQRLQLEGHLWWGSWDLLFLGH